MSVLGRVVILQLPPPPKMHSRLSCDPHSCYGHRALKIFAHTLRDFVTPARTSSSVSGKFVRMPKLEGVVPLHGLKFSCEDMGGV